MVWFYMSCFRMWVDCTVLWGNPCQQSVRFMFRLQTLQRVPAVVCFLSSCQCVVELTGSSASRELCYVHISSAYQVGIPLRPHSCSRSVTGAEDRWNAMFVLESWAQLSQSARRHSSQRARTDTQGSDLNAHTAVTAKMLQTGTR